MLIQISFHQFLEAINLMLNHRVLLELILGFRYQKTDNPSFSPRNRRNFGFDFDQRINLSLIGNIGERLQITANYDTESTFDFQNLVKLEFNPPKTREISSYIPEDIQDKMDQS